MAQQSSRLNRLLTLLDTCSSQATRFSAARQIGEIAKSHPQDLNALLSKQLTDTVSDDESFEIEDDRVWPFHSFLEQLLVDMFDSVWEIRHGSIMALREILIYQGGSAGIIMPEVCIAGPASNLKDSDTKSAVKREREAVDLNLQVTLQESEPVFKRPKLENAHCQVINARDEDLNVFMEVQHDGGYCPSDLANGDIDFNSLKVEPQSSFDTAHHFGEDVIETKGYLEDKVSMVKRNIFDDFPQNSELMNLVKEARTSWLRNCKFLQDCAIRFLCVLSLDRFGDYISDQVVAPVKETCAQALGTVLKYMHPAFVLETLNILLQIQHRPEWEIRHGSLLGIKYLVAVRQEMLQDLLGAVLPACKTGLEDPDDDIRAVAAEALIPASVDIVSLKGSLLHSIIMLLWDIMLDLDDLSPSTSSVMNLLAEIYSQEEMIPKTFGTSGSTEKHELDLNEVGHMDGLGGGMSSLENPYMLLTLAPRLWPFMRHSISSVRLSAIRTLERLLEAGHRRSITDETNSCWPSFIVGDTLRMVFQNLLLESNEEILKCSERVWNLLVKCLVEDLKPAAKLYLFSWVELASKTLDSNGSVVSMVFISWFKEMKSCSRSSEVISGISSNFRQCLLALLACSNPAFPTQEHICLMLNSREHIVRCAPRLASCISLQRHLACTTT